MDLKSILILTAALSGARIAQAADVGLPDLPGLPTADAPAYSAAPAGAAGELAALQARLDELLAQAKAAKEGADRLDKMVDRLLSSTGVRFGGEAVIHTISWTHFPTTANNLAVPRVRRTWPAVGYFDFKISARPHPSLSAEVVYRMEKVFGGYWGSLDISGVRRFNIHGDTDIGFDLGHFNYKHTPLTVWAPQDEFPFEIEVLARKRREGMAQVYLPGDNTWPLQGARLDATLLLFNTVDLALEGIAIRTAIAGNKNTGLPFAVIFPYDQYLVGGTAGFLPTGSKAFRLGLSYFEFIESKDTSITPPIAPVLRSNVVGGDLHVQLLGDEVVLKAEGANANYTFDYGARNVSWTTGGAGDLQILLKGESHNVKLHGLYVDEKFINYAAQTRTHASTYDLFTGQIPTGNNLLDPSTGAYGLANYANLYFTRYNPVIFATNQGRVTTLGGNIMQQGGVYLPAGELNRSLPYGWATPNRAGGGVDGSFSFADGAIKPRGVYGYYFEPYKAYYTPLSTGTRTYNRGGIGATVDLARMVGLPLTIRGGWIVEDVKANSFVSYTTNTGDFDLTWQASKTLQFVAGWQQIAAYGDDYDFAFLGDLNASLFRRNVVATTLAGGVYWALSKATDFSLVYNHVDYHMPAGGDAFGFEEFESKLSLRF